MDGKINDMDKISNLPDFILHRILSFLQTKDAARTCVLSKRWSFIWDSFPIFVFRESFYIKGDYTSMRQYKDKLRNCMNVVDKTLQKFIRKKLRMEILVLSLSPVDHNSVSMIDRWVSLALSNGVKEISLEVLIDLRGFRERYYTLTGTLFAVKSFNGSSTFDRLQKLWLQEVSIGENVIQDIIRSCPNITDFTLQHFCGLKTVKISRLDKLESVRIVDSLPKGELDGVGIDAPKLKYFIFNPYYQPNWPHKISLTSCHDLKELCLRHCGVTDDWLHLYLPRFSFLEKLKISSSPKLRRVRISGQQLKTFCLSQCDNIESIQIDAPSLSLFELGTHKMPILASENVSCPMEIQHEVSAKYCKVDSSWFLELRKFLGNSPQRKYLRLHCTGANEVCFDLEELGQVTISPPIKVDHLKMTSFDTKGWMDCAAFIDGLLWSCHPMTISVPPGSMFQNNYIKILCDKLLDVEQPSCCNSSHRQCWRHDLKAAKIESFGGIEDERLRHLNLLLDTLPSFKRNQEVRFNLEWEF